MHEEDGGRLPPSMLMLLAPAVALMVAPEQELLRPFGVANRSPDGKVSLKPTLLKAVVAFGFVRVKVSETTPPGEVPTKLNDSLMEGDKITATLANAVPPVPPSVEVTAPVVLFCTPVAVAVTFTLKVQDALVDSAPLERLMVLLPAVAVIVPPLQEPVSPLGVETTSPAGNVSVKAMPLKEAVEFGFATTKLKLVLPFSAMDATANDLVMSGGATLAGGPTVKLAEAALPVPALVDVTALVVLVSAPVEVPFTVTLKLHEPLAAMLAPVSDTLFDPAVAVMVPPPHKPVRPLGVATTSPAGNASVKATPERAAVFEAGFVIVKVRLVVPF